MLDSNSESKGIRVTVFCFVLQWSQIPARKGQNKKIGKVRSFGANAPQGTSDTNVAPDLWKPTANQQHISQITARTCYMLTVAQIYFASSKKNVLSSFGKGKKILPTHAQEVICTSFNSNVCLNAFVKRQIQRIFTHVANVTDWLKEDNGVLFFNVDALAVSVLTSWTQRSVG